MLSFNRYDLLEVADDKHHVDVLMMSAYKYAKKLKSKMLTIHTPTKRRGEYETRIIRHFDLDTLIVYYQKKIKTEGIYRLRRTKHLNTFLKLKEHLLAKAETCEN